MCLKLQGECEHEEGFGKFYSFPPGDQLKHMLEERSLASAIEYYHNNQNRDDNLLCDIINDAEYKKIKGLLHNLFELLTILWNTDGLLLSHSSQQELWVVLGTICEVPPQLRSSFVIVAGLYVGVKKPDMNVFLEPLCSSLQKLWENGFSWISPLTK